MEDKEKNCAFQFATNPRWGSVKILEDTDLITLDEAKVLWEKWLPKCIRALEEDDRPEMCIWVEMDSPTNYHKTIAHVTSSTKTDGVRLWEENREFITV